MMKIQKDTKSFLWFNIGRSHFKTMDEVMEKGLESKLTKNNVHVFIENYKFDPPITDDWKDGLGI